MVEEIPERLLPSTRLSLLAHPQFPDPQFRELPSTMAEMCHRSGQKKRLNRSYLQEFPVKWPGTGNPVGERFAPDLFHRQMFPKLLIR